MKHLNLINKMTIEEKAAILSGETVWSTRPIKRLGIPAIYCSDGPHGIRKQAGDADHLGLNASIPSTCFPTAATVANSWNEELGEEIGIALGKEAKSLDVDIVLGPGLNIKRSPLCGRNFEYFSEDPYLSGKMAAAYVKGIQSQEVYACPKHFAVNSQELRRMAMNSVIDERTLREIYLTGFEMAIKDGKAKTIMTSYNEVNGIYANENKHLLQEILRDEWGFDGIVITDWGASNDHVQGVAAGSNLEMPVPGLDSARELLKAIEDGSLTMQELDTCVDDLLDVILSVSKREKKHSEIPVEAHHALAQKAAEESIVLLKNTEHILPLDSKKKVVLVGDFTENPRYQGAGSSMVNPTRVESILEKVEEYDINYIGYAKGYHRNGEEDAGLKKVAIDMAKTADIIIYCFGLNEISESEGSDRTHMRIPQNQIDLLEEMVKVNTNIIGVMSAGSSVEMPWQHCLKAIVNGYLSGQAGASAMLNVLTGKVNPSGRLNETYPLRYEDTPAFRNFPSTERNAEYRESVFVGYRYFDTTKIRVQYPFGYGLSYTDFEYSNINLSKDKVTFTLKNIGKVDGSEVAQLYVGKKEGIIFRPLKELKGFKKVFLRAGESKEITIPLDDKGFRYYNVKTKNWEIEGGIYTIYVGANVADIKLTQTIEIEGTTSIHPYEGKNMEKYRTGYIQDISQEGFEELLGHKVPDGKWLGKLGINDAICQMYYAKSSIARFAYSMLTSMKNKAEAKGKPNLNILFIYNMPFRGIAKMTNGAVSMDMARGMVVMVNGSFFKGLGQIIRGYFRNKKENKKYENKLKNME